MASLQHLAHLEATKIAQGRGADPDPYEFERPLERQNRMSRSFDRISVLDSSIPMVPVSSVGKVDVTDAWGMSWAMDSPYDASIAYAQNPARMASRQSTYFAHPGFDPTFMDGHNSNNGGLLGQNEQASSSSPALSGSSTATTIDGGLTWSEASSASSAASSAYIHSSSSGGSITPPASANYSNSKDKRRSVSFHGDLAGIADGRKSPAARSWHERPRSEIGSDRPEMVRSRSAQPHARASTLQPSLLGNNRRMSTYSVRGGDTQSLKSLAQSMDLPPIPVDPKILAKKEKRMSKAAFPSSPKADRSSVYSPALTSRKSMDNVSLASNGSRAVGGNASKRKSLSGWLSRSTSSSNAQEILASPVEGNGKQIKGRPVSAMALASNEPTNAARNFIPPVPPLPLHATRSPSSSAAGTPLASPGVPLTPRSTTPSSANGHSPLPTPGKPHSNHSGRSTPNSSAPLLSNSASYNNSNSNRSTGNVTNSSSSNSAGTNITPSILSPSPAALSVPLAPILSHSSSTSSSAPSLHSGEGVRPASPLAQLSSSPSSSSSLTNTASTSVNGYLDVKSVQPPKSPTVVHVNAAQPLPQSVHAPRSSSIPQSNSDASVPRLKSKKSTPSSIQVQLPPGQQMLPTPPHSGTTTPSVSSESGAASEEEGNTTLRPPHQQELAPSAVISSLDTIVSPQPYITANPASTSSLSPDAARLGPLSTSTSHSSSLASLQGAPQIPLPPSTSSSFASGLAALASGVQGESPAASSAELPRSSSNKQLVDRIYSLEEAKAPSTPPKDKKYVTSRERESVISPSPSFHTAQGDNVSISLISPGSTPLTAEFGAMENITEEGLPRAPSRQSQHQQLKPRASSPNFRSPLPSATFSSETLKVPAHDAARAAHSSAPLANAQPQQAAAANRQAAVLQTPRKSKSPFSLFKRSRSKTLGADDAAKKVPALPNFKGKGNNAPLATDDEQTPVQSSTPQLSFSSSTTSRTTTNHSEPSDQFYADFAPRPEPFSKLSKNGSAVGSSTLKQSTSSATGPSSSNSKPSYSFASMFGTSGRKKATKP